MTEELYLAVSWSLIPAQVHMTTHSSLLRTPCDRCHRHDSRVRPAGQHTQTQKAAAKVKGWKCSASSLISGAEI